MINGRVELHGNCMLAKKRDAQVATKMYISANMKSDIYSVEPSSLCCEYIHDIIQLVK